MTDYNCKQAITANLIKLKTHLTEYSEAVSKRDNAHLSIERAPTYYVENKITFDLDERNKTMFDMHSEKVEKLSDTIHNDVVNLVETFDKCLVYKKDVKPKGGG